MHPARNTYKEVYQGKYPPEEAAQRDRNSSTGFANGQYRSQNFASGNLAGLGKTGSPLNELYPENFHSQHNEGAFENYHQNHYAEDTEVPQYNNQRVYEKERELKEINELRIRTLEKIIQEKVQIIQNQEGEITQYLRQTQNVQHLVHEREQVLSDYEAKFDKVREVMQDKEVELSNLKAQVASLHDQCLNEKDTNRRMLDKIDRLQELLKKQEAEYQEIVSDVKSQKNQENDREVRLLEQKLKEKDKRMESIKVNSDERLTLAMESKDKEIRQLQEQLATIYQDQQEEIQKLQEQIQSYASELVGKDKLLQQMQEGSHQSTGLLQSHVERLKEVLQQKTEMANSLDSQNKGLTESVNALKQKVQQLEVSLSNLKEQNKFDREQAAKDQDDLGRDFQEKSYQVALEHKRQMKELEREKKKIVRDFEGMKDLLRDKEQGVKSEIEKVWSDWEEKCSELEDAKRQQEKKAQDIEGVKQQLQREVTVLKKDLKQLRAAMGEKDHEVRVLQEKYEEELAEKESHAEELQQKLVQQHDMLQFEISHLKMELEKQYKLQHLKQLEKQTFGKAPVQNERASAESFKLNLNQVRGGDPRQSYQGYLSSFKGNALGMNDSVDVMKREFMNQYNNLMESNASSLAKNLASPTNFGPKGGPADNKEQVIRELQEENEELKRIVEEMRIEMENVVKQIKSNGGAGSIQLQQQIIQKERKIFEMERKLRTKDDEVDRLKNERDRLVAISNELRAELNHSQRIIQQLKDEADQSSGYIGTEDRRETAEFHNASSGLEDDRDASIGIRQQQERIRKLDNYAEELAAEMKHWIEAGLENQGKATTTRQQTRVGGGGLVSARSQQEAKRKSQSPISRMRVQGEEFIKRIERLQSNLQLEGQQLQGMQKDLSLERKNIMQSERQTPSQKRAQEKIKASQERKKQAESAPKVRNYNKKTDEELRREAQNENSSLNIPNKAITGVGQNSNLRRLHTMQN